MSEKKYCSSCEQKLDDFEVAIGLEVCYDCRDNTYKDEYNQESDMDYINNDLNWS